MPAVRTAGAGDVDYETHVIAEFDVPTRDDPFAPSWFLRCITRLERGLREYDADHELVAQGFLLPTTPAYLLHATPTSPGQTDSLAIGDVR